MYELLLLLKALYFILRNFKRVFRALSRKYDIIRTRSCRFAKSISFYDLGILGHSKTDCHMTSLWFEGVNKPSTVFSFSLVHFEKEAKKDVRRKKNVNT